MKECNMKSTHCERKQRKKGHHEMSKTRIRLKVKVQTEKRVP